jgi:hypothetical protein
VKAVIVALTELAPDFVLAPERHVAATSAGDGVPLGDLVRERRERVDPVGGAVVLDTSHARDGILDVAGALRDGAGAKSAKKRAYAGDLVVSRLRPYLRQIAFVHPLAWGAAAGRPLALSTEFYVLAPREADGDLAFLLPFLLSPEAQRKLAGAQEGGHHPRVPAASLFALRVPRDVVRGRARLSKAVRSALGELYVAGKRVRTLIG